MRPSVPDVHITDRRDAELAAYHAVCSLAVAGLIVGLLSPLALLDPMFWIVPVVGVIFSCWALRRIKNEAPALTGRGVATIGLALSLLIAVAAPTEWLVYRVRIRDEARQFSELWFRYIRQEEPQKAFQLTVPPKHRQPFDDRLWSFYRNNPRSREALTNYVANPALRTLLALGPRADVRFYDTAEQSRADNADRITQLYAVTYEEQSEKKSYFIAVRMLCPKEPGKKTGWRVVSVEGGVMPAGLKKQKNHTQ